MVKAMISLNSRRKDLADIRPGDTTNAGLWLDKYIQSQDRESKASRPRLIKEVAGIREPKQEYAAFLVRWQRALTDIGARCRKAKALERVIVGLGSESVLETSVTLHRTYGVPYIPGSALKGLASSYARNYLGKDWQAGSEAHGIVFGDTKAAGYLTFFDALYLPSQTPALHADVIAVHHEEYYRNKPVPPADWDDPNPVPFLSTTGEYLVALGSVPGLEEWVDRVFEVLRYALREEGVGAKTSSGYGRLELEPPPIDYERQLADALIHDISMFPAGKVAGEITRFVDKWRALPVSLTHKRRVAEAIIDKNRQAGREKSVKDKDWYKEILSCKEQRQ